MIQHRTHPEAWSARELTIVPDGIPGMMYDPNGWMLMNVNTPHDHARAKRFFSEGRSYHD
jgi:hypothetical protein